MRTSAKIEGDEARRLDPAHRGRTWIADQGTAEVEGQELGDGDLAPCPWCGSLVNIDSGGISTWFVCPRCHMPFRAH